ncbi:MAG: threonyl-tRNA synthetase editing domain-containing protein [Desulfobacula sp.]|uniref:threonyl-tRNA synthetase editing domain-containing protein n=1 Tax=Desulfobacula sp. TaxID=2593537 RepID=UPI0025C2F9F9|nr:threonyl-tRNA synthetase editing domain-containing protein [Desulfobacula sp.]MCD4722369.1 threonyl-tRNA synthetase editing domain-containing protein [Desulfobacula sp.]
MRVLFWYCDKFGWTPTIKTLETAPVSDPEEHEKVVVAFVHIEPKDIQNGSSSETKLVKNAKWLARKWDVKKILLHSFTHLAEEKAGPEQAKLLLDRVQDRLVKAEYQALQTAYGYFNDLVIEAKGHPLARIFKEF